MADGINIAATPFAICLLGTGNRNKRVTNEVVTRGILTGEEITVASTPGAHTATLENRAYRSLETTRVFKTLNGIQTEVLDAYVSFEPAVITGTVTSTANLTTNNAFAVQADGEEAITIVIHDVPAQYTADNNAFSAPDADNIQTFTRGTGNFLTIGIRPGMSAVFAASANNGTFTVLSVTSTTITYVNASGVANVDDDAVTLDFSGTGFLGREVHVLYNVSNIAAVTMTEAAAAINQALVASDDLGYGSAYGSCASVAGSGALILTSPLETPASDIQVFAPIATSCLVTVFGSAVSDLSNRDAVTTILISNLVWNSSATWQIDYAKAEDDTDPLEQTSDIQTIVSVGSSPGGTNFTEIADWLLTSDEIDWSPDTAAATTSVAQNFNLSTNDHLGVRIDGKTSAVDASVTAELDLVGLVAAPLGYAAPVSSSAVTAVELAANVNALLAMHFGPRYLAAATTPTVSGTVRTRITSQEQGSAVSSVEIVETDTLSADVTIFGGETIALGTGKRPAIGSVYYVTYEYTRPADEYDVPYRHFSLESALAQVGQPSPGTAGYNPLAIASAICFENGTQFIYTIQVDDETTEGNPTRAQVQSALEGAETLAGTTEIVVVGEPGTRLEVTVDMQAHLEDQCGLLQAHPRRIFCGMESGTSIGDRDTPDSLVGRATRTLLFAPTSPGRGRAFLLAPPQAEGVTRTVTFEDGTSARISLDGTYLAVAMAARRTSLDGPAETLTKKTITGFNTDDITHAWRPAERRLMAGNGVCVVTYDAGRFVFMDAMSTEGGNGGLEQFSVDSTSYQKDVITTKMKQALDANIVGIVPFDLATFSLDIKLVIQGVLAAEISRGTIAPFVDSNGSIRPIDLRTDIRVSRDVNIKTSWTFAYAYNLRMPALRLYGQHAVNVPLSALLAA